MENGRKRFIPQWLMRSPRSPEAEELQKNVMLILDQYNAVRRLSNPNGDGDEADLGGARDDLRATLEEIYNKNDGKSDKNPLWDAVMMIRPQVINGRLSTLITEEVAQALWDMKKENEMKEQAKAEFFGKLASRLQKKQITFFRAAIAGGAMTAKDAQGQWWPHYFPGIPFSVRKEAGVKLTTHPDNIQAVVAAYELMAKQTTGHAKEVPEAVIADIKELSQGLYPPPRK